MIGLIAWLRRRSRAWSAGQALVELSIIAVIMILLFGTVADFGRLFYAQITVENSARAGVLVAARAPASYTGDCPLPALPANQIGCAIAAESRGSGVNVAASEVTVSCENLAGASLACLPTPQAAARSRVTVHKQFQFIMPLISMILGNNVTMTASVTADQQSVPADATVMASASPAPTPAPTPTAAPSASPSAVPSAAPCDPGFAPVPDLVQGATTGSSETVKEAQVEWLTAGFAPANFDPASGFDGNKVTGQDLIPGSCASVDLAKVTVAH